MVTEQRDPRPPLRLLAAPLGGRRIGREHGPLQRCPQLPGGLVLRPDQHPALDRPGQPGVQRAGVLVDQFRPVRVDRALGQGRQGRGEPAGQAHRQVHPVLRTALRQRQGQRNLVRGEPGLQLGNGVVAAPAGVRDRVAVPSIRGPVAVLSAGIHRPGDAAAPGELGHRGEFLCLRPGGHLAPRGDRGHQRRVVPLGGLATCEPASQVRAGRHDGVAAERPDRQHMPPVFVRGRDRRFA